LPDSFNRVHGGWVKIDSALAIQDTETMKYARISFPSRDLAVQAYHELARRGRVVSLQDRQFIVPEPAVKFLEEKGLAHKVHEWLHEDNVTQTLRNSAPHPV
jgi:hypothetical protein